MSVYIVIFKHPYDGEEIFKVFADEMDAEDYAEQGNELMEDDVLGGYVVETHEVID